MPISGQVEQFPIPLQEAIEFFHEAGLALQIVLGDMPSIQLKHAATGRMGDCCSNAARARSGSRSLSYHSLVFSRHSRANRFASATCEPAITFSLSFFSR